MGYWEIIENSEGIFLYETKETFFTFTCKVRKNGKVIFKTNDIEEAEKFYESLKK